MNEDPELTRLAAQLPRSIEPARDLWPDVAERISAGKIVDAGFRGPRVMAWRRPVLLAAAAVALVVLSSVVTVRVLHHRVPEYVEVRLPGAVVDFASVESQYVSAAEEILDAVQSGRVKLSPVTVAVLEKNLHIIDDAISESRAALARDPANAQLREMVLGSYRHKLDLLRRVTSVEAAL